MKITTLKQCLLSLGIAAGIAAGIAGHAAYAAPVTILDYSFEDTTNTGGAGGSIECDGGFLGPIWHGTGNSGDFIETMSNTYDFNGPPLPAPGDGTNYMIEKVKGNPARVWQDVGALQPNTIYTLTIAVGNDIFNGWTTGSGEIALINGLTPFDPQLAGTPVSALNETPGSFTDTTVVFTNGYLASGDLLVLMYAGAGDGIDFDNVRLDATSMPTTAAALAITASPTNAVYVGAEVTLTENPAGTAPFTYQWQTDNGSGGATWSNVGGNSTNLSVSTTSFTPGSPVQYQVIVANSFGSSTSGPIAVTANNGPPVVTRQTLPAAGSDVVGSSVTFSAQFDGTQPITYQWEMIDLGGNQTDIIGATNSTLTITNLQLSDFGFYFVEASNPYGSLVDSAEVLFAVTNEPTAAPNGIVISEANQAGLGGNTSFSPSWTVDTNDDLLLDLAPTYAGGVFTLEGSGGTPYFTDGQFGFLRPQSNASLTEGTCGNAGNGFGTPGTNLIYTLPPSAVGWDLTNITVYGGWSDTGRDWQRYLVYYSTTADPTSYNNLIANVDFQPENTVISGASITLPGQQSATRVIITSTNGAFARNVAGLEFVFNPLASPPENGYEGYTEFQTFGTPSAPLPVLVSDIAPGTGFDVVGSSVTFKVSFSSSTPITYQWFKDGAAIPDATNTTLTLTNLQLTDSSQNPGYSLQAKNAAGIATSSASSFLVNSDASPDSFNVIDSLAGQSGISATYTPTWVLAPDDLISGLLPTAATYITSDFNNEGGGGIPVLTDGSLGSTGGGNNSSLAPAGNGGAGHTLVYTLPAGSTYGYDISNIVTFAGWSDTGRDAQAYTVSYSTVTSPTTFTVLDTVSQVPAFPTAPNQGRVTLSSASGGVLAANVYAIEFDFTTPTAPSQENGYSGYSELQVIGAPSAALTSLPPTIQQDIEPVTGTDVVGSAVTFTSDFIGSGTISYQWQKNGANISGATGSTLTLNNLQLTDSGDYNVLATSTFGTTSSSTNTFTVNPLPTAVNGTIAAPAYQSGYAGLGFTPTWAVESGSLIAGQEPSASSGGAAFNTEGCGGINYLTDGTPGTYGNGNGDLTSGGPNAGTSVAYSLSGSATGYDLNQIVVYAGWVDAGRNSQGFTVAYSTVSNPSTFISLTSPQTTYGYIPGGAAMPNGNRLTVTSATAAPLAQNVAQVQITFTTVPNGWSGYGQIQLFGTPSVLPSTVKFGSTSFANGNLILTGTGGTANSGYTLLSTTNLLLPLSEWTTNATGTFGSGGGFSNSIPVGTAAKEFFRLRAP